MDRTIISLEETETSTATYEGYELNFTRVSQLGEVTRINVYGRDQENNDVNASRTKTGSISISFSQSFDTVVANAIVNEMEGMVNIEE